MGDRLYVSDVAAVVGVTHATIRQHVRRGTMPGPDGFDGRRRWWRRSTIEKWMKTRRKPGNPNFRSAKAAHSDPNFRHDALHA